MCMRYAGSLSTMLPWLVDDVEEIDAVFGGDAFPYGIEANRATLQALVAYMVEQHFIARPIDAKYDGVWELPALGAVTAPAAVLIRPDGHVAWVGDHHLLGLPDALTAWFGPPATT